jgi:hypothetical protein
MTDPLGQEAPVQLPYGGFMAMDLVKVMAVLRVQEGNQTQSSSRPWGGRDFQAPSTALW